MLHLLSVIPAKAGIQACPRVNGEPVILVDPHFRGDDKYGRGTVSLPTCPILDA